MLYTHYFLATFREMQGLTDYFYSILEIILAYTHFAFLTELLYNSVFNDYFSAQQ